MARMTEECEVEGIGDGILQPHFRRQMRVLVPNMDEEEGQALIPMQIVSVKINMVQRKLTMFIEQPLGGRHLIDFIWSSLSRMPETEGKWFSIAIEFMGNNGEPAFITRFQLIPKSSMMDLDYGSSEMTTHQIEFEIVNMFTSEPPKKNPHHHEIKTHTPKSRAGTFDC